MTGKRADSNPETDADAPYRPSVVRTLRKSVADAWLYLALFVGVNVIWVVLLGLPLGALGRLALRPIVAIIGIAMTVLTVAVGNAILFHVTNRIAHGDACARDLWRTVTDHFAASLAMLVIIAAIAALAIFNVHFYLRVLPASPLWRIIGIIWGYVVIMFALAMAYSYPLLVDQGCGAWSAMRRSTLLFLDNPGYTLGLAGALLAWTFVVILPVLTAVPVLVGLSALVLCFIEAGFVALVANNALLELTRKYETQERKQDAGGCVPGHTGG